MKKNIKEVKCSPVNVKITRIIEQEKIPHGFKNDFKAWDIIIKTYNSTISFRTSSKERVLEEIRGELYK